MPTETLRTAEIQCGVGAGQLPHCGPLPAPPAWQSTAPLPLPVEGHCLSPRFSEGALLLLGHPGGACATGDVLKVPLNPPPAQEEEQEEL